MRQGLRLGAGQGAVQGEEAEPGEQGCGGQGGGLVPPSPGGPAQREGEDAHLLGPAFQPVSGRGLA